MSSGPAVRNVLGRLKRAGQSVGSLPALSDGIIAGGHTGAAQNMDAGKYSRSNILDFKSYNPSLTKSDFSGLLPQSRYSAAGIAESARDFDVLKVRDPRYFQFKDKYQLIFANHKSMREFSRNVAYSRIEGAKAVFTPNSLRHPETRYAKYVSNLEAAFESSSRYFELLRSEDEKSKVLKTSLEISLETLRQAAQPMEAKSLLVWNFPADMPPYVIVDRFWLYDIKHCFKLYWDAATGRTLTFMAFNTEEDCVKFSRNFHGVFSVKTTIVSSW
ncbi:LAME_0E01596g1_1 [Lachancea meyersii CBS 8951]|uniref:LAME_0E01596g1_1 n=1 Tax=Lachancea meyersii CBS 8951 TaxID=1266667 RepID=A0A1G4JF74_9SACH|nr:LAME_0E01596g1_1 [Lachancea meyersii CBS 8951]